MIFEILKNICCFIVLGGLISIPIIYICQKIGKAWADSEREPIEKAIARNTTETIEIIKKKYNESKELTK